VILEDNTAMAGGGLYVHNSSPSLSSCQFLSNTAWWGSGGGVSWTGLAGNITDCVFRENSGYQAGGGMASADCDLFLERCEFSDNIVDYYGGGFECYFSTTCELVECTFARNRGADGGGVAVWGGGSLTLRYCTLVENQAVSLGGGVFADTTEPVALLYTIIAFSSSGGAVHCLGSSTMTLNCCDLFGNVGGDWTGCVAGQLGLAGNISEHPLFCGPLNPAEPFTLCDCSPCAPFNYPCSLIGAWPVGCVCVGGAGDSPAGVADFVLHAVVPNPFNPRTTVSFSVGRQQRVAIGVYGMTGKHVVTLVDRVFQAGDHSVEWNGRDSAGRSVSSGSYLVRVETEEKIEAQKVLLLR